MTPLLEFLKTFPLCPIPHWPRSWSSVDPHLLAIAKLKRSTSNDRDIQSVTNILTQSTITVCHENVKAIYKNFMTKK